MNLACNSDNGTSSNHLQLPLNLKHTNQACHLTHHYQHARIRHTAEYVVTCITCQVSMAKMIHTLVVTVCSLVQGHQCFRGTCSLHLQCRNLSTILHSTTKTTTAQETTTQTHNHRNSFKPNMWCLSFSICQKLQFLTNPFLSLNFCLIQDINKNSAFIHVTAESCAHYLQATQGEEMS